MKPPTREIVVRDMEAGLELHERRKLAAKDKSNYRIMTSDFDEREEAEDELFAEDDEKKPKGLIDLGVHEEDELRAAGTEYITASPTEACP